ncbi:MAG: hypothetical protein CSA07_03635 [Bacteroidia bacterium]|nr:MAG: hypothetical protein CSA07_03635 [Bacteroidia bacterium]
MAFTPSIPEEQLKNEVADTVFFAHDCTRIIGKIDFAVYPHTTKGTLDELVSPHLWAEAKKGRVGKARLDEALVQLLLTIGKARTFDRHTPPKFLGAFDCERIIFLPYAAVQEVFYQNDFNWNVPPSDHGTREFRQLAQLVADTLEQEGLRFELKPDRKGPLSLFVQRNFNAAQTTTLLQIDRNNFISIYSRWLEAVQPTIAVRWDEVKAYGIIDADFYLADILSRDNHSILDKLNVLLQDDRYRLSEGKSGATGRMLYSDIDFNDGGTAHANFWRAYQRPPDEVYWDYILERRDLLVPQDVRERKGSFFTPRPWVEISQQYLADYLGADWQDEYYVWDCAAGTGNLLAGLTNKYNIWASTLDQADIDVMHQRIANGANLLESHVFRFDFLNDDFSKLPKGLRQIVEDPEKRKKLVVYINPPYAEATNARTVTGTGANRSGLATEHLVGKRYGAQLGKARNELFAQFIMRVYQEMDGCILGHFSKIKMLQGANFTTFRHSFNAELKRLFVVPGSTFDNVQGQFPIGFFIWDTGLATKTEGIAADVYSLSGKQAEAAVVREGVKRFYHYNGTRRINEWMRAVAPVGEGPIVGHVPGTPPDFQHNSQLAFLSRPQKRYCLDIQANTLIPWAAYFAVRLCIKADWLNDRDQFLWPNDGWLDDPEFHSDCLAYALLHGQNRISFTEGTNHWIPFPEAEVNAKDRYASHFMLDFIAGKLPETTGAPAAQALLDAGLALWRYYHAQPAANVNASYYDIRHHFQGVSSKGRMNPRSDDAEYNRLAGEIRAKRLALGEKIAEKVYEYEFLAG